MEKVDHYKVALVVPLFCSTHEFDDMVVEYLGFGYIASYLRKHNIHVEIIDPFVESLDLEAVVTRLIEGQFNLLGFTLMSSNFFNGMQRILDRIPNEMLNNIHIMVGGYYATFLKEQIFQLDERIHSLIVGEGEVTINELVANLKENQTMEGIRGLIYRDGGQIMVNSNRPLMTVDELEAIPLPARDHLDIIMKRKGKIQVNSSRGCFGQCTFCAVHSFYAEQEGRKWRGRSAENVVREIEELVTKYNVRYIHFSDEEFIGPGTRGRERAKQIARLLIERNVKIKFSMYCRADNVEVETFQALTLAGLDSIFLGVEFGVQSVLNYYRKGITVAQIKKALAILEDLNIRINIGFMMFEPLTSLETFRENLEFCIKYTKFTLRRVISRMAIYPYSDAYYRFLSSIDMDDVLTFDDMFGDHYQYRFKDPKVEFLYKLLYESLQVISPSKKYLEIRKMPSIELRNKLLAEWSNEVYVMIDSLATQLIHETDFTEDNLREHTDMFKEKLSRWDSGERIEVAL